MRRYLVLLLALVVPIFVYWLYAQWERRRATQPLPTLWGAALWPKLAAASVGLLAAGLLLMTLLNPSPQAGAYQPARVVDGVLIPGRLIEVPAAPVDPVAK